MQAEATVWLKPLGGRWQALGTETQRNVRVENLELTSNTWGPDTARFQVKREPLGVFPDLNAFTEVEIEVGGTQVWSGRVQETPTTEGQEHVMSIECRGWQHHLDDDLLYKRWTHGRLGEWDDIRTKSTASLTFWTAKPTVEKAETGVVKMGWSKAAADAVDASTGAAIILDFGPQFGVKTVYANVRCTSSSGSIRVVIQLADSPALTNSVTIYNQTLSTANGFSATVPKEIGGSTSTARRYAIIYISADIAFASLTTDFLLVVDSVLAASETAYLGTGGVANAPVTSQVRTKDVVAGAVDIAAPKLLPSPVDADGETVDVGQDFEDYIPPEFTMSGFQTPREIITAINSYNDWQVMVKPDRTVRYRPWPTTPEYSVGEWSGTQFEDASMNSGEEMYNRSIGMATDPLGDPIFAEAYASSEHFARASVQPTNPSFAVNTTGWAADAGDTIVRDTVIFDSTPASLKVTSGGTAQAQVGASYTGTWNGAFEKGKTYKLVLRGRYNSTLITSKFSWQKFSITIGGIVHEGYMTPTFGPNSFRTSAFQFVAKANGTPTTMRIFMETPAAYNGDWFWIDDVEIVQPLASLIDLADFFRTKSVEVGGTMTQESMLRLAEIYVTNHQRAPFKGSLRACAHGVRGYRSGTLSVHPALLLLAPGQLMHFSNRIDPDTGALGRDGRIAQVTYNHNEQEAQVSIDNQRNNFEALISRLSAVIGQRTG
jgi:hypothetical protein